MTTEPQHLQWCIDCGARFTECEVEDAECCPLCGSVHIPCAADRDVTVEVNWHELRVLGLWAENWARTNCDKVPTMPKMVLAICRRLQSQHPNFPALTLSEELAALPEHLEKRGIRTSGVHTNVPRPALLVTHGKGAIGYAHNKEKQ